MAKDKVLQVKSASDKAMRTWNEKMVPIIQALNQMTNVLMQLQVDVVRDMAKRDGVELGQWAFNPAKQQWEEQPRA